MAKIYISSTYNDLTEYRKTVYKTLRKMGHDVIAMEDYVASDERPVAKCLLDVQNCDIYIGIFAWRYGFIPKGESLSITEQEYKHAKKHNIPCLIFLLDEKIPWPPNYIDSHTCDGEKGKLINMLRESLKNENVISFFDGIIDLAVEVAIAINRHEREIGLVRKPPLWEYLLTIDLLKLGLKDINKQYSELNRSLIYKPYKTINRFEILEWIRQKLDDLVFLITLLKISSTEELMNAWGEPGQPGNEENIRDSTIKILTGCKGLLEWEIDLAFTRFPDGFEDIKKMMQGWTYSYIEVITEFQKELVNIFSNPDAEGKYEIALVFEAPKNIDEIVPEVKKVLRI